MRNSQPHIDLRGQRFFGLVAIRYAGNGKWLWKCDCGKHATAIASNVKRGNSKSCGCVRNQKASECWTKHGLSKTDSIAYRRWEGIRARVTAKSGANFRDYASKGITMCAEWLADAAAFVEYIGEPPTPEHTVDRIDNSKGYDPGNVRWATPLEQANNKTNNRIVEYRGEEMTLSEMIRRRAADEGLSEGVMRSRVERQLYGAAA